MDMYGISRGIIFCFFWKIADSTLTDSTDSRIPCGFRQKRSATLQRPGPPAAPLPPRARGIPLGLEPPPRRGTGQQSLPLAHFTGGQRAKQLLEQRPSGIKSPWALLLLIPRPPNHLGPLLTSSCRNDIRWSYHRTRCERAAICLCVLVVCLSRDCPPFVVLLATRSCTGWDRIEPLDLRAIFYLILLLCCLSRDCL